MHLFFLPKNDHLFLCSSKNRASDQKRKLLNKKVHVKIVLTILKIYREKYVNVNVVIIVKKCVILILLLLLAGCEKESIKENEDFQYYLFATPLAEHPIWLQSKEGFEDACSELNVKCDWMGPKIIDTESMGEVIEQGILQNADGIITQGVVDPELLKEAKDNNVPIILVDSNMPESEKLAYFGKDFEKQAKLILEETERHIDQDTKLIVAIQVAELDFDIATEQIKELENALKDHPGGYEIVSISESKSDAVRAQSEWTRILADHPDINLSVNFAAESAEACGEIAVDLGIKDQLFIFGVDDMETTIDYIKKGYLDASIVTSFYQYGHDSLYLLYNHNVKNEVPAQVNQDVKLVVVNRENADTYMEELRP